MARIFQLFFTTRPIGVAGGLDLSQSYDHVTKGHGGEIVPSSVAGKGASFNVRMLASKVGRTIGLSSCDSKYL